MPGVLGCDQAQLAKPPEMVGRNPQDLRRLTDTVVTFAHENWVVRQKFIELLTTHPNDARIFYESLTSQLARASAGRLSHVGFRAERAFQRRTIGGIASILIDPHRLYLAEFGNLVTVSKLLN